MSQDLGREIYAIDNNCGGIQVRESDKYRWVHFGSGSVQTASYIQYPNRLCLEYMRRMLAFLPLRQNRMGRVLILGLGGGAMVRAIHESWPDVQIDAVDIDQDMIAIATEYFGIPESENVRVRNADAFCYIEQSIDYNADTVFVDLFAGDEPVHEIYSENFVNNCYEVLNDSGVLIFNILAVKAQQFTDFINLVRKVFERQTLCLTVPSHDNILLFAFKSPFSYPSQENLLLRAQQMQDSLLLPFDEYMRDLIYTNRNNQLLRKIWEDS